ncbi:MAG: hypothetical protein WDW36_010365 [Sanguina aurantia]
MGSSDHQLRSEGLGYLSYLADELIFHVLSMLDEPSLSSACCSSKLMRLLCCEEALWMGLALQSHDRSSTTVKYLANWRQTCLSAVRTSAGTAQHSIQAPQVAADKFGPMQSTSNSASISRCPAESSVSAAARPPDPVPGFNSLFLYRRWYRAHMDLRSLTPLSQTSLEMPREGDARRLSADVFAATYDWPCLPVVLERAMEGWNVQDLQLAALAHLHGAAELQAGLPSGSLSVAMKLSDYLDYSTRQHDEEPLYIFDSEFGQAAPELLDTYHVPQCFGEDHLELLGPSRRPPFRWLVAGPARCGASWHVDPHLTSAWNALLQGTKRWALYPPHVVPPGVRLRREGGRRHWGGPVLPGLSAGERPHLEFLQQPGEVVFVPGGWWHCVLNLTTAVAVTQNFVSDANMERVTAYAARGSSYYFKHPQEFYAPGSVQLWRRWCSVRPSLPQTASSCSSLDAPAEATIKSRKRQHDQRDPAALTSPSFDESEATVAATAAAAEANAAQVSAPPAASSTPGPHFVHAHAQQVQGQLSSLDIHVSLPLSECGALKHLPPVHVPRLELPASLAAETPHSRHSSCDEGWPHQEVCMADMQGIGSRHAQKPDASASSSSSSLSSSSSSSSSDDECSDEEGWECGGDAGRHMCAAPHPALPPAGSPGRRTNTHSRGRHPAQRIVQQLSRPWTRTPWLGLFMQSHWARSRSGHAHTALQRCLTDSCHGAAWEALLLPLVQRLQALGPHDAAPSVGAHHLPAPTTRVNAAAADRRPAAPALVSDAAGAVQRATPSLQLPPAQAGGRSRAAAHAPVGDAACSGGWAPRVLSPDECMPIVGSTCLVFLTRGGVAIKMFLHQRPLLCTLMRDIQLHVWNLAAAQDPDLARCLSPAVAAGSLCVSVSESHLPPPPPVSNTHSIAVAACPTAAAAAAAAPHQMALCAPAGAHPAASVAGAFLVPFLASTTLPQHVIPWAAAYPRIPSRPQHHKQPPPPPSQQQQSQQQQQQQQQRASAAALGTALAHLHSLPRPAAIQQPGPSQQPPAVCPDWAALLQSGRTAWHDRAGNIWVSGPGGRSSSAQPTLPGTNQGACGGGGSTNIPRTAQQHTPAGPPPTTPARFTECHPVRAACDRPRSSAASSAGATSGPSAVVGPAQASPTRQPPSDTAPSPQVDTASAWWPFVQFLRHRTSAVTGAGSCGEGSGGPCSDRGRRWHAAVRAYLPLDPAVLVGISPRHHHRCQAGTTYGSGSGSARTAHLPPAAPATPGPKGVGHTVPAHAHAGTPAKPLVAACSGAAASSSRQGTGIQPAAPHSKASDQTCSDVIDAPPSARAPVLLHGDLTAQNVHVRRRTADTTTRPEHRPPQVREVAVPTSAAAQLNTDGSAAQCNGSTGSAHAGDVVLLDFGDAGHGDPLYDFVALHGTCFRAWHL